MELPMKERNLIPTLSRPKWNVRRQTAIQLRDTSPSMDCQKAIDAEAASRDLVKELGRPRNKGTFDVAVIDFNCDPHLVLDVTAAEQALAKMPPMQCDGSTDIKKAIEKAETIVQRLPLQDQARPIVLLLSDGAHNGDGDPVMAADRLKAFADIVTIAFGDDADEEMLRHVATSNQHYYHCTDGADLRFFFQEVGTTLSIAMQTQEDPALLLGNIERS